MPLPTSVQPDDAHVDQVDDDSLWHLVDPGAGFPSADLVNAAAALHVTGDVWQPIEDIQPRYRLTGSQTPDAVGRHNRRREGRDYLVAVGAGTVGVRLIDHERRACTAGAARPAVRGFGIDPATGEFFDPTRTRVITAWSRKSRANMTRCLSELDYAQLLEQGTRPIMGTLTYPSDWLTVAPDGATVKGHLRALMKRWHRRFGYPPAYLWKLEFQDRRPEVRRTDLHGDLDDGRAPHFHLFICPPAGVEYAVFKSWLSDTWADVVAHPDPEERRKHQLAGTNISHKDGARSKDPKRLAVYFTKHGGAAGGKEYQHRVPRAWTRDTLDYDAALGYGAPVGGPGRFWGHVRVERVRREVYVSQETYVRFRRALRRHSEAQQLRRTIRVPRGADRRTGEVTYRTVTRSKRHLAAGGLNGGFLLVNDGPALAAALSRWESPAPRFLP